MYQYDGVKLQRLTTRLEQLQAVNRDLAERLAERQRTIAELKFFAESGDLTKKNADELENLHADVNFLHGELNSTQQKQAALAPAIQAIEHWLKNHYAKPDYTRAQPKPPTDLRRAEKELAKAREQIESLIAQRDSIENAPLPRAEAVERISCWVESQAAMCRLDHFGAHAASPSSELPKLEVTAVAPAHDSVVTISHDLGPQLCWLFGEMVVKRLADTLPADDGAIPMAERPAMIAKLDASIAKLALAEEELVGSLEAGLETVARRPDVDPAIVLNVRVVPDPPPMVAEVPAGRPTTVIRSRYLESGGLIK